MHFKIISFFVFLLIFTPSFAIVTVGTSSGSGVCDRTTIAAGIQYANSQGDSEIRVLKNQNFLENISINHSVSITGGYNNCNEANDANTSLPTSKTFIYGDVFPRNTVITINLSNTNVTLNNLYISDNVNDPNINVNGHGVAVKGTSGTVYINNSTIANNRSTKGGGVYVEDGTDEKNVNIVNTSIFANQAIGFFAGGGFGGGVYCSGTGAHVVILGESEVSLNSADTGGGVVAEYGCTISVASGIDVSTTATRRGIMNNSANFNGGGIYVGNDSRLNLNSTYQTGTPFITLGDSDTPATIANNVANGKGGGVYAEFGSRINIKDALIDGNSAVDGGGIYITTESNINASFSNYNCWSPGSCMVIRNNTADSHGGAVYFSNTEIGSSFNHTLFYGNRANAGTAMYIQGLPGTNNFFVVITNSSIYNNGNDGAGSFADFNVFQVTNNARAIFNYTTIVDNDVNDTTATIRNFSSKVEIHKSIIHNSEDVIKEFTPVNTITDCLVVNEDTSVSGPTIYVEDPGFVNRPNNDYHLTPVSFAVDLCAAGTNGQNGGKDFDLDSRGIDILSVMNIEGPYDAGSDEYNDHEAVFKSGFE